jgi:hypothetical protein
MKLRQNKKLTKVMATILCLIILSAMTFAWITARDTALNRFETASSFDGGLSISEIFVPPTDWMPGQTIDKDVKIINTGDFSMSVRVSFEEILLLLANNGVATMGTAMPTYNTTGTYAAGTLPITALIPSVTNITDFTVANGWNPITNITIDAGLGTLPAGAVVLVKQDGTSFGAKAYVPLTFDGKAVNQSILLGDFTMSESGGAGTGYDAITIHGVDVAGTRNIQYPHFAGYVMTEADWAGDNVFVTNPTAITAPLATDIGRAQLESVFGLIYGSTIQTTIGAASAGDWYYQGGYFYYLRALSPGMSTTSLLSSVHLASSASTAAYANLKFDLGVVADGIQNSTEALTATDGWNLNATTDAALIAYLIAP